MKKCFTPCIYYHETYNENRSPKTKVICDIKDGADILSLSNEEVNICTYFTKSKNINRGLKICLT